MLIPTNRTLLLIFLLALVALLASIWPGLKPLWEIAVLLSLITLFVDAALLFTSRFAPPECSRQLHGSIPLNVQRNVTLSLHHTGNKNLQIDLHDHFPIQVTAKGMPTSLSLKPEQTAQLEYQITAKERGEIHFPLLQLRIHSWLGLWKRNHNLPVESKTRVYPNFAAVAQMALLATDNRLSQLGIMKKRRRGEGQDFHQLREYRDGDSLRQIDWKATSRTRKLISREYQDERDQEVIFLLDCGHRMTTKDNELSHFDHTLNAMLLLSYVALKQGDSVGLATFSGTSRWLAPRKGQQAMQQILNTLYDLQPSDESPDYTQAATQLLLRHKKRALVILLSNIRDEDSEELTPAIQLLKKRHLVLLASLREEALDEALSKSVSDQPSAIRIAALHRYLQQRSTTFEKLRNHHTLNVDVLPSNLTVELINSYLNIKRSGML